MLNHHPPETIRLRETPADALGPSIRESVHVANRTFVIDRPDGVDRLIDHPNFQAAAASEEYMPYWANLWPASRMLAQAILCEPWLKGTDGKPQKALELGCGLGLPGIAALARGLHVIFSDYDAAALRFAAGNARVNGFSDFELLHMDWRRPPDDLHVPVILASEVIYDIYLAAPMTTLIKRVLAPGGFCLLMDSDRLQAQAFRQAFRAEGLSFTDQRLRLNASEDHPVQGTLYRITHLS